MGKPFGEASRRAFGRIGTLVPFPCWNSLGVMSSDTPKFSKQPPSEALKGGLPVPARRSACLRRSGFAQAGVSARRRVRFATVRLTQMLQYRTRAGILPNPCNCGFFGNEGLQRISLYVKSRFCLETHAANSQRCRCKALRHPALSRDVFRRGNYLL